MLCRLIPPHLLIGCLGDHAEHHGHRVERLDEDFVRINNFIFDVIGFALLRTCRDDKTLRVLVVGHDLGRIGFEGYLTIVFVAGD